MSEAFRQEPSESFLDRFRNKKLADAEEDEDKAVSTEGIEVKESTGPMLVVDNTKDKKASEGGG